MSVAVYNHYKRLSNNVNSNPLSSLQTSRQGEVINSKLLVDECPFLVTKEIWRYHIGLNILMYSVLCVFEARYVSDGPASYIAVDTIFSDH